MKNLNSLLLAGLVAGTFVPVVQAHDTVSGSPKAQSLKPRVVPGTNKDVDMAHQPLTALTPRGQANEVRIVAESKENVDTLADIRNSTLSPRAQQQLGSRAQFEIAPMVTKNKEKADDSRRKMK